MAIARRAAAYSPLDISPEHPTPAPSSTFHAKRYDALANDPIATGLLGGKSSRASSLLARLRLPGGADGATCAALGACAAYSACSISMVLANKTLVTTFGFKFPFVLMLVQNLISLALVVATRVCFPRFAAFSGDGDPNDPKRAVQALPPDLLGPGAKRGGIAHNCAWRRRLRLLRIDPAKARAWAPVTALFVAMLCTSFEALHRISVPTVNVFKNVTNVLIAAGDFYLFGKRLSRKAGAALGLMVAGGALTYATDLDGTPAGYAWMGANVCVSAGYALALRAAVTRPNGVSLSRMEMVYYNAALSALPVALLAWYTGELGAVFGPGAIAKDGDRLAWPLAGLHGEAGGVPVGFVAVLVFSGAVGFLLLLAALRCVERTSSTTYAVVGALNKVPLTILGALLFRARLSWKGGSFIAASLAGGVLYASAKNERRLADARARAQRADDEMSGFLDGPTPDPTPDHSPRNGNDVVVAMGPLGHAGPAGALDDSPRRINFGAALGAVAEDEDKDEGPAAAGSP